MTGPLERISAQDHSALVEEYFVSRGYSRGAAADYGRVATSAAAHGVHSHGARKCIDLDRHYGYLIDKDAAIERVFSRWDAKHSPGPTVAYKAIDFACETASRQGLGMVTVRNANHYLWGGEYALRASNQGFIAFTTCTGLLPEVVPHNGRRPTLGTNPWTWALPMKSICGFDLLSDWATSQISMSTAARFRMAGIPLPARSAIDPSGSQTTDAAQIKALLPFGAHKGYSLGLITELLSAFAGNGLPSQRGKHGQGFFLFLVISPEMVGDVDSQLVSDVVGDILRGNEKSKIPGELEHLHKCRTEDADAIMIPTEDVDELNHVATELRLSVRLG